MSTYKNIEARIRFLTEKKRKELSRTERVQLLQLKLYLKAKQEKGYKFYVLYDKISLSYILEEAYRRCKKKNGAPGIDEQTFKDVEENGRDDFLKEIQESLRTKSYKAQAVKRVWMDKENGGQRPLGIPTIRDRVVQQACKLVIEPIWDADFDDSSHGFRPNRSAKGAVKEIRDNLRQGNQTVYDADLSKFFDTIPHDKLKIALKERIVDSRVLNLINQWLKVPIVEEDGKYKGGKKNRKGTPQGGVISPLLANIYMNLLDRIVNKGGSYFAEQGIRLIRYADDFILMGKSISLKVLEKLEGYLQRMGLRLNAEKTKLVNAKEEFFDFLGFQFRYDESVLYKGTKFWKVKPKPKSCKKIRQKINKKLKQIGHYNAESVVRVLNPMIRGWMNYYRIERVSYTQVAFRELDNYLRIRLMRYYNRKSQRKSSLYGKQAYKILVEDYGLVCPYQTSSIRPVNADR
jgi:group II intron reverse transcriptase/maturase